MRHLVPYVGVTSDVSPDPTIALAKVAWHPVSKCDRSGCSSPNAKAMTKAFVKTKKRRRLALLRILHVTSREGANGHCAAFRSED